MRELTAEPRLAAFRALKEVAGGRRPEESLVAQGLLLSPRDLGLATALVYETLRHRGYLDGLMKSRLAAGRAGPDLALVLELGLAQLLFFDRLGDHAVVSETVALAKAVTPGRQGLVNAILRGLLREREAGAAWPPALPLTGDPARDLARRHSYQEWYVRRLMQRLGPEETEELLLAGNKATPPTLRVNPRRGSREELQARLPFETRPTALSPWGLAPASFDRRPEDWPGFEEGRFAVQDEASQLVGLLAGPLPPGSRVLDGCSGLGGKSLHLAALNPGSLITAQDKNAARLELLTREAARLGCDNIQTRASDLLAAPPPPGAFDLVLVDAPCSGLGVIRRRPDLKWNKTEDDLRRLAELQGKLLSAAAGAVKPGGRLIYGVCSFSRAEGPATAARFLAEQPGFQAEPPSAWPVSLGGLLSEGGLTLWPHRQGTDGFFWALFKRSE
ncbi:MAG: 16S rRNA (cytosine(967)-C(5))-methyltransferase RsmB [Candidatus Adiutrix sp.]|jgi:16S rRNA (cytosine967-C5)-methyltransferase|nr:16S rRNA (cytosine(967)-C(5))-methyltransferase RsmB [Candidatus Adiutrix sp.]